MLKVVPPLAKVRDIRSALRRRSGGPALTNHDTKVVHLSTYRHAKIIHFPTRTDPTTVA
ncbi:hypothetical protein Aph01nite_27790 [Acrocarpospora phusangensis]|uniref:Uncharacterized protein n=1 Tax=Acrocarpospora phusangensis TaxID=1070424 RepID=A0A919UJX1_9ACTN|nr:hypothetical protein [Acrocarpospora phusangensis]GIH24469.1 hypothetical protein Aph01nite_27790 [Acrocarpospora phusangensis]